MIDFGIGDLVEVKKDTTLSPALRFFHNKKGMIIKKETYNRGIIKNYLPIEWKVLFPNQKTAIFKDYELDLITSVNKKG